MSDATLLLAHTSARPQRVAGRISRGGTQPRWLFLCDDHPSFVRWRNALSEHATEVPTAPLLRSATAGLRQLFLDRITELGREYDSLAWWASRVSERNTMVSPLFLHCCYLRTALTARASGEGELLVICQSWAVLETLAELVAADGARVRWITRNKSILRRFAATARAAAQLARWLASCATPGRRDSAGEIAAEDAPVALVRTWVDDSCFGAAGAFRDRYLPGVAEWLEGAGWRVVTVPVLFNVSRSDRSAWRWFASSGRSFLNPDSLYKPSDHAFALRVAARQLSIPAGPVAIGGIDVTRLFDEERRRTAFDPGCLDAIVSYRLPRRLAARRVYPDLFVAPFENMIPEKAIELGFRRYLPHTRLVGIQAAALYPLHLCLFVTAGESGFAPMPDRVVCSGRFFRDVFLSDGLPAERVVAGPALRYAHLRESGRPSDRSLPVAEDGVLVLLSLVPRAAAELLLKVTEAFGSDEGLRVLVKPHPMAPFSSVLRAAGLDGLPAHFELLDGSIDDALARSRIAVGMETNAVYESVAAGVPVVVVGRTAGLDLNPLAWYEDFAAVFSDPAEIRAETLRLLSLSPAEREAYRRRGREILEESFNPVTDETMRSLVDDRATAPSAP